MKGTTYGGSWDSWYGPSGREGEGRPYNTTEVRESRAGSVLSKVKGKGTLPEDHKMLALRAQAEVSCVKPEKAEPCIATQQVCLFNITGDPCELNNIVFRYLY